MVTNRASLPHEELPSADFTTLLTAQGIESVLVSHEADLDLIKADSLPDLVLFDLSTLTGPDLAHCFQRCGRWKLPVLALVPESQVARMDLSLSVSDFILTPLNTGELVARARQILRRTRSQESEDLIRAGDLVINPSSYEVMLSGRRINLRFKEYELLRLLATNPGRVYTRETLLSQIWGYDYFGGTRTVDVHIRRLRSKIEDADHSLIETIWNVGYRFRDLASRT